MDNQKFCKKVKLTGPISLKVSIIAFHVNFENHSVSADFKYLVNTKLAYFSSKRSSSLSHDTS